ncbi:nitroreductase/quinone reductase family protein [Streptomyces sp. NPDC001348]
MNASARTPSPHHHSWKACAFPGVAGGVIRLCRRAVWLCRPLTTAVSVVRLTGGNRACGSSPCRSSNELRHRGCRRAGSSVWPPTRTVVLYRVFGGRLGLWRPHANGCGALRLTTTGRRTGRHRSIIIRYFEDGPTLVSLAINGWGEGPPAWWLNLQTHPDVPVDLVDGHVRVTVRPHWVTNGRGCGPGGARSIKNLEAAECPHYRPLLPHVDFNHLPGGKSSRG